MRRKARFWYIKKCGENVIKILPLTDSEAIEGKTKQFSFLQSTTNLEFGEDQ